MSMTKTAEDFAKDLKSWNSLQKRGVEVHLISFDDGNGNLESFVVEDWNFYFDEYKDFKLNKKNKTLIVVDDEGVYQMKWISADLVPDKVLECLHMHADKCHYGQVSEFLAFLTEDLGLDKYKKPFKKCLITFFEKLIENLNRSHKNCAERFDELKQFEMTNN
jgi:hypothetical protein